LAQRQQSSRPALNSGVVLARAGEIIARGAKLIEVDALKIQAI